MSGPKIDGFAARTAVIDVGPLLIDGRTALVAVLAIALALVHLVADEFPLSDLVSRPLWLTAAGGVSVAYVFVHLFPKLDAHASSIDAVPLLSASLHSHHVYLFAGVGLASFYGLERLAQVAKTHEVSGATPLHTDEPVFWVHVASFSAYNAFVGYLLVSGELVGEEIAFSVAMALHLLGNDEGMRNHHREAYHRFGRWVLAAAVLVGTVIGFVVAIGDAALTIALAIFAGGSSSTRSKRSSPRIA